MSDECLTPKKKPAKILFKKAPNVFKHKGDDKDKKTNTSPRTAKAVKLAAGIRDTMPIPPSPNDEALSDFLNRVSKAQQSPKKPHPTPSYGQQHQHHHPQSPAKMPPQGAHTPPAFAMLPEYARYQEARFQRVISRGNSFGNMSPKSPGFEWVDHRTSPRSVQSAWDANTLVAQHAFPSSIFCAPREEPSPMQAAAMAAMHQEYGYQHYHPSPADMREMAYHDYMNRRSFHDSGSIPSAAALSRGSSSSWSEDEEQRQFMDYMNHGPPAYAHLQQQQQQQRLKRSGSEDSQEARLVEISPGVHEPLRKADETVTAVRHDFYVPVCCFGCSEEIFCIADAKYVICPTCRVVSPIEEGALDGQVLRQHGLGLGFNCESLFQIQSEILHEER